MSAILVVAAIAVGVPMQQAKAQRTGSRIGKDAGAKDGDAVLAIMADCIGGRNPAYVRTWMKTVPGSDEEQSVLQRNADGDLSLCMDSNQLVTDGKSIRFKPRTMRAWVATVLVRQQSQSLPAALPVNPDTRPWFMDRLAGEQKQLKVDAAAIAIFDFGHCVSVSHWQGTRELLMSKRGSVEEQAAIKMLMPSLGACLSQDVKIELTPAALRRVLSEPVYHILQGDVLSTAA